MLTNSFETIFFAFTAGFRSSNTCRRQRDEAAKSFRFYRCRKPFFCWYVESPRRLNIAQLTTQKLSASEITMSECVDASRRIPLIFFVADSNFFSFITFFYYFFSLDAHRRHFDAIELMSLEWALFCLSFLLCVRTCSMMTTMIAFDGRTKHLLISFTCTLFYFLFSVVLSPVTCRTRSRFCLSSVALQSIVSISHFAHQSVY